MKISAEAINPHAETKKMSMLSRRFLPPIDDRHIENRYTSTIQTNFWEILNCLKICFLCFRGCCYWSWIWFRILKFQRARNFQNRSTIVEYYPKYPFNCKYKNKMYEISEINFVFCFNFDFEFRNHFLIKPSMNLSNF